MELITQFTPNQYPRNTAEIGASAQPNRELYSFFNTSPTGRLAEIALLAQPKRKHLTKKAQPNGSHALQ